MRIKSLIIASFFILIFLVTFSNAEKKETFDNNVPIAAFLEDKYEFLPVVEGTKVKHSFEVKNNGNAKLKIEKVKTS